MAVIVPTVYRLPSRTERTELRVELRAELLNDL
jgi:hypothetical protein